MTEVKIVKAWVNTAESPTVGEVSGLIPVATGWIAKITEEGGTATFRIAALDSSSQPAITGVYSHSPPNASSPTVLPWAAEGDEFVSSGFKHGDEFRIEVSTAAQSSPVAVGGGHFRVVEEAGG